MNTKYSWAVVGAGPAGIAAVGQLIDQGIHPQEILWIDPSFRVGDFGSKWAKVSSNTKVELFTKFYQAVKAFEYNQSPDFAIKHFDPKQTCELSFAAEPLSWISRILQNKVNCITAKVEKLALRNRHWQLTLPEGAVEAKQVILAIGSEPRSLNFPEVKEIDMPTALNPDLLKQAVNEDDKIAVFGSSHSAIIIIKNLLEHTAANKIINFYLSPLRYAVYLDNWILFDDTGLKGKTAVWARENIDGQLPDRLERLLSTKEQLSLVLPECSKAIYATGFKARHIPVEGMQALEYNDKSGIIAPGLFGFGIAFPESKTDPFGTVEHRVGLWKFMDYIQRVMPVWVKYAP